MTSAAESHVFAVLQKKETGHVDSICFSAIDHVFACWSVLYRDTENGNFFIEVTSGAKKFKIELVRPKELQGKYNWKGMVANKQAGKVFLCAVAIETTTGRIVAASFRVNIAEGQLITIDEKLINFYCIADYKLQTIQRNSQKPAMDCIFVSSKSSSSAVYYHLQLTFDGNGEISHSTVNSNLNIPSEWNDPFILGDQIYFLHKSKVKLRHLSQDQSSDIEVSGLGHGFANIGPFAAVFADSAMYYLVDEEVGELWLLNINQGSWQKLQAFSNHVLTQKSTVIDVLSNGKLYAHGNCSQNDCKEQAHVYRLELVPEKITNPTQKLRWDEMKRRIAPVAVHTMAFHLQGQQTNDPLPQFAEPVQVQEQTEQPVLIIPSLMPGNVKVQEEEEEVDPLKVVERKMPELNLVPNRPSAFKQGLQFQPQQQQLSPYMPQTTKRVPNLLKVQWPPPQQNASQSHNTEEETVAPRPKIIQKKVDANKSPPTPKQPPEQPPKPNNEPLVKEHAHVLKPEEVHAQIIPHEQEEVPAPERSPIQASLPQHFPTPPNSGDSSENKISHKGKWMPRGRKALAKLGEGAFGVVWKCCDEDLRLFVAKEAKITGEEDILIAENEVEHLKTLSHKHVVKYYGCVKEDHKIVIYMEFMPGGSLRTMLNEVGVLAEPAAIRYIRQILDGLAYIHSKLVLHSDLKCDNLLLDGHGTVKIGDFGIAVQMCLNKDMQSFIMQGAAGGGGTLYWMAPEVIRNEKYGQSDELYGRAADMWYVNVNFRVLETTKNLY